VTIFSKDFGDYAGRNLRLTALDKMEQGLYLIRLVTASGTYIHRVIKLSYK
jgi:hypothetical protein